MELLTSLISGQLLLIAGAIVLLSFGVIVAHKAFVIRRRMIKLREKSLVRSSSLKSPSTFSLSLSVFCASSSDPRESAGREGNHGQPPFRCELAVHVDSDPTAISTRR